jgi:hypothetical protein
MGSIASCTIVKSGDGGNGDDDESPAFGALAAGLAIIVVMAAVTLWRRP